MKFKSSREPRRTGNFTSKAIMDSAGKPGMVNEKQARWACGFHNLHESKFEAPHQGSKEMRRRQKQLQGKS
jgi:hypothetical protein